MSTLINQTLLIIAVLTTGIVYGTDMFHAIVVKKAAAMSSDRSVGDLTGHTHLIADKRMPVIGVSSVFSTALIAILNYNRLMATFSGIALLMLLIHLTIYITIAKPINAQMSAAATEHRTLDNIRALQNRWDSVITYRAGLLTIAMLFLLLAIVKS
jgi:hypothetical protein